MVYVHYFFQKHGARIIIGNFYENKARVIFCEAYKEKMYGSKYVWIITGGFRDHPKNSLLSFLEATTWNNPMSVYFLIAVIQVFIMSLHHYS